MYKLINPHIEGTFNTTFDGGSDMLAAEKAWLGVSQYISNPMPEFAFSLENTQTGGVHHYKVTEKQKGDKQAKYKIAPVDLNLSPEKTKQFKSGLAKGSAKAGGKPNSRHGRNSRHRRSKHRRHSDEDDSSSSSSSSDSDLFSSIKLYKKLNKNTPITYWWYDPWVYNLNNMYVPTFVSPLTPTVEYTTVYYV